MGCSGDVPIAEMVEKQRPDGGDTAATMAVFACFLNTRPTAF